MHSELFIQVSGKCFVDIKELDILTSWNPMGTAAISVAPRDALFALIMFWGVKHLEQVTENQEIRKYRSYLRKAHAILSP